MTGRTIKVKFIKADQEWSVTANQGETLMHIAHRNNIDLECACEGSLACSTCHVVLAKDLYQKTCETNPLTDDENDMLDLAYGLTATSRLGCQVRLTTDFDGTTIRIPADNRNTAN